MNLEFVNANALLLAIELIHKIIRLLRSES